MPEAYYCWLVELIGNEYVERNYQKLLNKLFHTPFYYELDYDRNRAIDGLQLRNEFFQHVAKETEPLLPNGERTACTVLEMMIALARNAEDSIMWDPDKGDRTGQWFWVVIQNLGLDIYDDYNFHDRTVDHILYVFMHHLYSSDGTNGGGFPCPGVAADLRKTDLWWQLNTFFLKNYPVEIW